jgi:hypothetical protein
MKKIRWYHLVIIPLLWIVGFLGFEYYQFKTWKSEGAKVYIDGKVYEGTLSFFREDTYQIIGNNGKPFFFDKKGKYTIELTHPNSKFKSIIEE